MTRYAALTFERHRGLRLRDGADFHFAARDGVIPLSVEEMKIAALCFPLAFMRRNGACFPVAVMGAADTGDNLFVAEDGQWLAPHVPATLRAYPFALRAQGKELVLAVDETSPLLTASVDGVPLYDRSGALAPEILEKKRYLERMETLRRAGAGACRAIDASDCLIPFDGAPANPLLRIDAARLAALPAQTFLAMRETGALEAAYSQIHSMLHVPLLQQRAAQRAEALQRSSSWPSAWLAPLEGTRLTLRRLAEEDAGYLCRIATNEDFVARYNKNLPAFVAQGNVARRLRRAARQHPLAAGSAEWVMIRKPDGARVGLASLASIDPVNRRAEFLLGLPDEAGKDARLDAEASLLVLDHAFNRVKLNKLTVLIYADNAHAQKNILHLGFSQEGALRAHVVDPQGGGYHDVYLDGLTQAQFRCNRNLARWSLRLLGRDITLPQSTHPRQTGPG